MSDQERAVIEAAKGLTIALKSLGEWHDDEYGQPTCIVCGQRGMSGKHTAYCQLAILMNAVDEMETNPAFYSPSSIENKTLYGRLGYSPIEPPKDRGK